MPRRVPDGHMHEYDDNWKCRCGYQLIADLDPKTGRMSVKAYVTPQGVKVPLGENANGENDKPSKRSGRAKYRSG